MFVEAVHGDSILLKGFPVSGYVVTQDRPHHRGSWWGLSTIQQELNP